MPWQLDKTQTQLNPTQPNPAKARTHTENRTDSALVLSLLGILIWGKKPIVWMSKPMLRVVKEGCLVIGR